MKSKIFVGLALVLCTQLCTGQDRNTKIKPGGETAVSASFGKTKLVAVFWTSTVDIGSPPFERRQFAQCTYSRFPCVLTGQMKILVNERDIFVPVSAYADLGDVLSAEFSTKGGLFVLTVRGGDASESYIVRLSFNKERLLERRVYSGEDPYNVLEVTRYYQVSAVD